MNVFGDDPGSLAWHLCQNTLGDDPLHYQIEPGDNDVYAVTIISLQEVDPIADMQWSMLPVQSY